MLIKIIHGWETSESQVTPEDVFINRRQLMAQLVGGAGAELIGLGLLGADSRAAVADPSASYYPACQNPKLSSAVRPVTSEKLNTTYKNFCPNCWRLRFALSKNYI